MPLASERTPPRRSLLHTQGRYKEVVCTSKEEGLPAAVPSGRDFSSPLPMGPPPQKARDHDHRALASVSVILVSHKL